MPTRVEPHRLMMPVVALVTSLASLGLVGYFTVEALSPPTSEFDGDFEAGVAKLFGLFALGGIAFSATALLLRPKRPSLSEGAGVLGMTLALVPPALVIAFVVIEHFG